MAKVPAPFTACPVCGKRGSQGVVGEPYKRKCLVCVCEYDAENPAYEASVKGGKK